MLVHPIIVSKKEEQMENGQVDVKRQGSSTKRQGSTTKRNAEDTTEIYSKFGAYGDYQVTVPGGNHVHVMDAVTIRVLDHGELNLVTDSGHWFLFAPNSWTSVSPAQPKPGVA
jgi:hypothetical protein